ncbi:DUF2382 domain-containing protein [Nesterenkonia lutea]|uniref:Uncharacterized protein (TIGR02271 family) n=1 Tax=Nesterenkonia lutea TaxID=272919 RepID=A0ABR9JAJ8_9MICC|nr:PRC and DUF2382 domain-containing protein [Nesterenkonia lutea]MBE1522955.1 uncharacterized protein (TIGR02271 family) [Nesterenkonia lutea]
MVNDNIDIDTLENADVYDVDGAKVGSVGQVYVNDRTQEPEFVTVNIGLFGTRETFVPFHATQYSPDGLRVPFTKGYIKDAPNIDVDGHLSTEEERRLLEYYSVDHGAGAGTRGTRTESDAGETPGTRAGAGAGETERMVAHEERLNVGTEQREKGEVHLRKRVRTEHQNVEVPVQREELVVEREEVDQNNPGAASAGTINDVGEDEETVTLREERPVVEKETVATEKVNVGKRTVQDTETVSGDVRKEEIDVEGDGPSGANR